MHLAINYEYGALDQEQQMENCRFGLVAPEGVVKSWRASRIVSLNSDCLQRVSCDTGVATTKPTARNPTPKTALVEPEHNIRQEHQKMDS